MKYIAWYTTYGIPDVGVPFETQTPIDHLAQQQLGELLRPADGCRFSYVEECSDVET